MEEINLKDVNEINKIYKLTISAESEDFPKTETRIYTIEGSETEVLIKVFRIGFEFAHEFPKTKLNNIHLLVNPTESEAQRNAKKIRESLAGREHSDSVELLREDRQR